MMGFEDSLISEVIGCKDYHKRVPEYGERAWMIEGKDIDVVYWDEGNGWCTIMQVIPKECQAYQGKVIKFYKKLFRKARKYYEEEGVP